MVDVSKIKVGDEVTVRATVAAMDYGTCAPVRIIGGSWIYKDDILVHTPKPREFKPGDMVTWGAGVVAWELVATANGFAFLKVLNEATLMRVSEIRHVGD